MPGGGPPADVIDYPPRLILHDSINTAVRTTNAAGQRGALVQLFQAVRIPSTWPLTCDPGQVGQYSMIRVNVGVIPDFRTALTVTLPALPEASSIWPLPR